MTEDLVEYFLGKIHPEGFDGRPTRRVPKGLQLVTLLARFLHPRYYSALTSVLLNNCTV